MYFYTWKPNENNEYDSHWHIMHYKEDFIKMLTEYECLPFKSISESLKSEKEKVKLVAQLAEKNTRLMKQEEENK